MLKQILNIIYCLTFTANFFNTSYAQSNLLYNSVVTTNTTGSTDFIGSYIIDWNIGQVFTKNFTDQSTLLITSGFIQSKDFSKIVDLSLDSLIKLDQQNNLISIYPNPTNNIIYVFNSQKRIIIVDMSLLNIKGELIKKFDPPFSTPSYNKLLFLSNIVTGTYIISINYIIDNRYFKSKYLKIIKI